MFETLETGIGLDIVLWLQGLRFGLLDNFIEVLDFAGEQLVFIAALGLVYWAINKKIGMRMLFALIIIGLLTFFVKDLLARPRPYQVSDLVNPLVRENQYGFPSGHVSIALMVWGYLAIALRKHWFTIGVVVYVILQFFARMFSGAHFPHDAIGGLILGGISLALYVKYLERVVDFWKGQSLAIQMFIPVLVSVLGLIAIIVSPLSQHQMDDYGTLLGLLWGGGVAAALEARYVQFERKDSNLSRAIQYVLGLGLAMLVIWGIGAAFDLISETGVLGAILRVTRYGLVAIVALSIVPYLSIRFNLMQKESE